MKVAKQKSQDLARLAALVRQMKVGMLTTIEIGRASCRERV